jgi:hypothetical protein
MLPQLPKISLKYLSIAKKKTYFTRQTCYGICHRMMNSFNEKVLVGMGSAVHEVRPASDMHTNSKNIFPQTQT